MDFLSLSSIYVTAVEFNEMGLGSMIEPETLNQLVSELERINQKTDNLSYNDKTKVKYILLILNLYGKSGSINHLILSNEVLLIKEEIS